MPKDIFNVASVDVVRMKDLIGGVRWVQLRFHHTAANSPLIVQMPEHAWAAGKLTREA
jgi:hypothetical protein